MLPIALDTNAYSAFKRGHEEIVALLAVAPEVMVCSIVVGELLAGFAAGNRDSRNRLELTRFLDAPGVRLVDCGVATADRYASVYRALRKKGRPIPTNDLWVAASCLEHGAALVTFDSHFSGVDGLRVGARLEDLLP